MENEKKVILFDGTCNLCNSTVQFVIEKDRKDLFRFAPLQSDTGTKMIAERNIDTSKIDSIILIEPGVAYYTKSTAALEIGRHLRGYRTLSSILRLIPNTLRDIVYDFIARNRYRWFGKENECMVPTPELKAKFLD
ncbi:MAG: DUF393 domain-containing protein [Pricia sp.]|nr:DUF393 domain-containing protein [Pricia sp.]